MKEVTKREDFQTLVEDSRRSPVFFLKHSTRCPISKWAFDEVQEAEKSLAQRASFAFLDLIAFRELSNFIAVETGVKHESPQLFYLSGGEVHSVLTHQDVKATVINDLLSQKLERPHDSNWFSQIPPRDFRLSIGRHHQTGQPCVGAPLWL